MRHFLTLPSALAVLGALAAGHAAAASPQPERSLTVTSKAPRALGLLVKLKDAPSHEQAAALGTTKVGTERLQGVMRTAGLAALKISPNGRAAQRVDFDHVLSAGEAATLAARLRAQPEVEWVVPNDIERRLALPTDPRFPKTVSTTGQWWLQPVSGSDANVASDRMRGVPGVQGAWDTTTGNAAVTIAILDSGVTTHPDLSAARYWPGRDFVSELAYSNDGNGWDTDPSDPGDWVTQADLSSPDFAGCGVEDSSWHGTTTAGIAAAASNDGVGVAGVNWTSRVLPVRISGKCGATVGDIVDGMRWAAGLQVLDGSNNTIPVNPHPARVINLSFGGSNACNQAYQSAIDDVAAVKTVVVAPAGNESGGVTRPANCSGVVGVAAVNRDGFKASYSNFGPSIQIATVGGDTSQIGNWGSTVNDDGLLTISNSGFSTPGTGNYVNVFGTSFSTPLVSGVLSLMVSVNPNLTTAQLIDGLKRSARPHVTSPVVGACANSNPGRCICTTSTCGAGLMDAAQALVYAANPTGYTAPNWSSVVINTPALRAAAAQGQDLAANGGSDNPGNPNDPPINPPGDSGGGALGFGWLLGLLAAVAALRRKHHSA
ncbi:S8 family peptidase [Rhizobacter sp. OV335]|uniref:S8 family peptidase n=1 Tax=Rhizobacter sp. OV335 TaxID=1500264 RepID=UPI00090FCE60|nr:S8 family peptidase [Rhizobacter sp. OV335]SHM08477.1 serine protease [Rhizobacter sp. OV335]